MKKLLSLFLSFVMFLSVFTGISFSALAQAYGDYEYTVSNGEATITDYLGGDTVITIPSEINGYPVKKIGNYAFESCYSLTSVTIPNSVITIGYSAFSSCFNLKYVTIPNSVTNIEDYAFQCCYDLGSVTIGNSVTSIGADVFWACDSLTEINVLENNQHYSSINGVLFSKDKTVLIQYPEGKENSEYTIPNIVTSIDNNAFDSCSSLTEITIPNSVTSIGDSAFENCVSLTEIIIPDSVISIGNHTFYNCDNLTEINVLENNQYYSSINGVLFNKDKTVLIQYPEGKENSEYTIPNCVITIGDSAFESIYKLYEITIPNSVTSIGNDSFNSCSGLTEITIPDSVTSIGDSAFAGCDSLTEITIPDSVTCIGNWAFANCERTTEITIPYSVTNMGEYAFYHCTNLKCVTIQNGVTSIGDSTFEDCVSLTEITIQNGVTSIGDSAFENCDSLTEITIPNSVTSIGDYAFYLCDSLTDVTIGDGVTSIGDFAFRDCASLKNITIGNRVSHIGEFAFYSCDNLTNFTIPDSVTCIGNWAFAYCGSLIEITIPYSVTNIGEQAFYVCENLKCVTIQNGVTSIGADAFGFCDSLTEITIPDSVTSIGDSAFEDCDSLTCITIPNSVISIGYSAFFGCDSLTEITIHDSVTSIGDYSFCGCSKLKNIYVDSANKNYCSVNGVLFNKDKTDLITYPSGKSDSSYKIPESVQRIDNYDFYFCSAINSVIISKNITYMGYMSFTGCDNISDVYFEGDEATWKKLAYTEDSYVLPNATIHYNFNYDSEEKKPDAPTGFDVTGTGNQGTLLYLDWEDSANADGYRMYVVSGDKEYYKGEVTESLFKFTDLTAGWNYSLRIEAFNSAGTASTETTICAAPAPMTADDITLSTSGSKLNISWEKQTCTGYVVQWSTDSSFKNITGTKYIDKPWNTSYSVNIADPQNYYVRVRAYKTYNGMTSYGDFSPAVKEKVLPGTITGFDIIGTGNKGSLLYLDWNGMANTDGYKVYVVSGEKEYLKGTTTDSQFKFTDLTPGWNYTVKVVAYNADGETETTTTICAAPATMTTDDFTAKASGNKLNISWDKQTCTGYVVQWSTDSSFKNITGTKYIDKPWNTSYSVSISNPQNYYVRVRAYKTYNGMTAYGDFSPAEKAVK